MANNQIAFAHEKKELTISNGFLVLFTNAFWVNTLCTISNINGTNTDANNYFQT